MSDERYVLVPVEATEVMVEAVWKATLGGSILAAERAARAMIAAAPPPDDAVIERVARALCEQQVRHARRFDTQPPELEAMMPRAVDYAWKDFIPPATAAIAALCGGRIDG